MSIRIYVLLIALVAIITIAIKPSEPVQKTLNNLEPKQTQVTIPPVKAKPVEAQKETVAKPVTAAQPQVKPVVITGSKQDWMAQAGIPQSDFAATDYIVSHESSWNYRAVNQSSGAYGLCQALPASKMSSVGADWATNPITQLKWCHLYAQRRGGWWSSFAFWQANHWW